jgi:membrane associated rhomboid family serine protease
MREASVGFHCPDDVQQAVRSTRGARTVVGARLLQSPPYVTIALIALNVLAYLWTGTKSRYGLNDPHAAGLFQDWQLQPYDVHAHDHFYELLTAAFLHVNLLHIGSNMLALGIIGPPLESLLGRWRFTALYLLAALGGSAAIYAFGQMYGTTVGASGAIFGLFGASLVLVRKLALDPQWLVGIVVINFVLTFSISGISKLGHIGGFVTGALAGLAIGGLPKVMERVELRLQVAGLVGLGVLIAIVVGVRTATF